MPLLWLGQCQCSEQKQPSLSSWDPSYPIVPLSLPCPISGVADHLPHHAGKSLLGILYPLARLSNSMARPHHTKQTSDHCLSCICRHCSIIGVSECVSAPCTLAEVVRASTVYMRVRVIGWEASASQRLSQNHSGKDGACPISSAYIRSSHYAELPGSTARRRRDL